MLDIPSATPFEILNAILHRPKRPHADGASGSVLRIFRVARALKDVQAAFHKILNSTSDFTSEHFVPALKIGKLFTGLVIIAL